MQHRALLGDLVDALHPGGQLTPGVVKVTVERHTADLVAAVHAVGDGARQVDTHAGVLGQAVHHVAHRLEQQRPLDDLDVAALPGDGPELPALT